MTHNNLSETLSLDGTWQFKLGTGENWQSIQVPGCWEAQGFSKFIEGPAYYRKEFKIPLEWSGQTILIEFDAVSYACNVNINGIEVGNHCGLWTPFYLDLTAAAHPGEVNTLEVEVYKPGTRYPMRSSLAGFIPDIATTFGGIWQPVRLRAVNVGLDDLRIETDIQSGRITVNCAFVELSLSKPRTYLSGTSGTESSGDPLSLTWQIEVYSGEQLEVSKSFSGLLDGKLSVNLTIPAPNLWSPAQPSTYLVRVTLLSDGSPIAQTERMIGFRKLSAQGNQLMLNGMPYMARGILSWGWEPDRIAPYYSLDQAREEIHRVRALGFNMIKLCLFVPNQAYFEAADEEGMLLWQELPLWLPEVTPELRSQAPGEYSEITKSICHHPSVALYSLGCELSHGVDGELLGQLNRAVREQVSDVLVCDNSGSGESYEGLDFDYADFSDYHPYFDLHYFEPLLDNWRRDWQPPRPWIFGEFCDSDTYRDLDEIIAANGGIRPWWLTTDNPVAVWRQEAKAMLEWQERLAAAKLEFNPQQLTQISYAQSQVIRKFTLEAVRRRAGMGGYVVTGLRDTPISTSGLWDDFNRAKWSQEEYLEINSDSILCLEVGRRRRWRYGGDRPERLDVHNFWSDDTAHWRIILSSTSPEYQTGSQLRWTLRDENGGIIADGNSIPDCIFKPGTLTEIGAINCQLPSVDKAIALYLTVTLENAGNQITNHWPIWVYPPLPVPPSNLAIVDPTRLLDDCGDWLNPVPRLDSDQLSNHEIILTTIWDTPLMNYVKDGGKVLLLQQASGPLPALRSPFWREAIKLFADHPLWDKFPHKGYTDMQFFGLASDVVFDTASLWDVLPGISNFRPILRRLDARQLVVTDYLFEACLGKGILIGCALRLQGGQGYQPYGWQKNVAGGEFLSGLIDYLYALEDNPH